MTLCLKSTSEVTNKTYDERVNEWTSPKQKITATKHVICCTKYYSVGTDITTNYCGY